MKNKTLEFTKNIALSTPPYYLGGVIGAELSDLVIDNETAILISSTAGESLTGWFSLLGFHARDNKETYKTDNHWNLKKLASDGVRKLLPAVAAAEIAYGISRTALMKYLLSIDYSSSGASITADIITTPVYFLAAITTAKYMGTLKDDNLPNLQ